jgi:hypothetical protein
MFRTVRNPGKQRAVAKAKKRVVSVIPESGLPSSASLVSRSLAKKLRKARKGKREDIY